MERITGGPKWSRDHGEKRPSIGLKLKDWMKEWWKLQWCVKGRFFLSFPCMIHNREGLMRKKREFIGKYTWSPSGGSFNGCRWYELPHWINTWWFWGCDGIFQFWSKKPRRESMLGLCQEHNQRVMNSYYRKRQEQFITYKSGGNKSQADYVLCKRHEELRTKNC